jgi:Rrf2 family protein
MLKLTKKADYGLIALRHLSRQAGTASAKDIADQYRIPLPLLSKVLQTLVRNGLLRSEQGAAGGYRLARDPHDITALEAIRSIDGPIILTHCVTEHSNQHECDQSQLCPVREPLRKVHEGILRLLSSISVADLSSDDMAVPSIPGMVSSIQQAAPPSARPRT